MVSRRKVLQLVSGASAVALAGCFSGGSSPDDGDDDGTGTDDGEEVAGRQRTTIPLTDIGTSTAEQDFPQHEWSQLEDEEVVETDTVTITQDYTFDPMLIRVAPGTTVTWECESRVPEWVIIPKVGFEESVSRGGTLEYTFEEPGAYNYVCRLHEDPGHIGRVIVDETLGTPAGDGGTGTDDGGMGTTDAGTTADES